MAVEHPAKVHAVVDIRGESRDLSIAGEALLYCEDSGQQQRCVDG